MRLVFNLLATLFLMNNIVAQQTNLKYFINQALINSPLLKDWQNQILSNKADSMIIRAGFGPQVNAISNNLYAPVINGWGYDEAITNGANLSALLSVTKEIVGKRNRENQYQSLRIQNQSLLNAGKITEQDLIKNVTEQYLNAYGSWQQYIFDVDILVLLRKEELILKRLTEQNIYKQTEYLTFLITLQQQEFQAGQAKSLYQNDLATLMYLCGIEDTLSLSLSEPDITLATIPEVQNSIFYQSFITDSLKLGIEEKKIDFSYNPKVSLFGDAGYNSSLIFQPWKNFGGSFGINISVPIYDGRQRKIQHDKIHFSEQTRQNYRTFYIKQYQQQINQLYQQLNSNQQLVNLIIGQLTNAQILVEANRKLLEAGDVRINDYIIAINNLLNIKNSMVQNNIQKYHLINQINYWGRTK
jgi:outer membrane protein TolC